MVQDMSYSDEEVEALRLCSTFVRSLVSPAVTAMLIESDAIRLGRLGVQQSFDLAKYRIESALNSLVMTYGMDRNQEIRPNEALMIKNAPALLVLITATHQMRSNFLPLGIPNLDQVDIYPILAAYRAQLVTQAR